MLLTSTLTVPVDVLNQHGETISRGEAKLTHLHGDCAVLHFPSEAPQTLIHWGTLLRFWISDGPFGYEIDGVVVAHKSAQHRNLSLAPTAPNPDDEETLSAALSDEAQDDDSLDPVGAIDSLPVGLGDRYRLTQEIETPSTDASAPLSEEAVYREVVLRLVHSRPFSERRTGPRRWKRFSVRFQRIGTKTAQTKPQIETLAAVNGQQPVQTTLSATEAPPAVAIPETMPCWERAWAIDLSAGGIRLRTHSLLPARQLYALQFWLPGDDSRAVSHAHCFALRGRVLRSQQIKSRTAAFEAMLGFEQLTAADGLALSEFLSN